MPEPKILVFDIETSPHLSWHFNTRNVNIRPDQIKQPTRMICWAAKWVGEKRVYFGSEYHHDRPTMLLMLWSLIDEADVTVTYNGDNFDIPHVRREFHQAGLPDPSPFISVDMYKVIKKREKWASHQMGYITRELGLQEKLSHNGFEMWREAMGDFGEDRQRKAWNLMRRYNRQDLKPTEDLFNEYLPVIPNLPAAGLWTPPGPADPELPPCPNPLCVQPHVTRQGFRRTKTRRYPQFQCQGCGKWFSQNRSESGVTAS